MPKKAERRLAMKSRRYIGMDVHQRQTYFHILDDAGNTLDKGRIPSEEGKYKDLVKKQKNNEVHVALEASTMSWWVEEELRKGGAEVEVTNPYKLKLISCSRQKTDKADAYILADLLRCNGLPRAVYVPDKKIRKLRSQIRLRRQLINQRTRLICSGKAFLRSNGRTSKKRLFHTASSWEEILTEHEEWTWYLEPLAEVFVKVEEQIKIIENCLHKKWRREALIKRLMTIPGIGIIAAYTIVASIADPVRFTNAKQVAAYSGLVPSERSSGEEVVRGRITKEGRNELRQAMVQAAYAVLHTRDVRAEKLKKFFYRVMYRSCGQKAIVALARKLIMVAYQVWKQDREYIYVGI